jgi:hypothetical protein
VSYPALVDLLESCCAECEDDLEHCHGTAIVHADGRCECSDDIDCRALAEVHAFAVACREVDCPCC